MRKPFKIFTPKNEYILDVSSADLKKEAIRQKTSVNFRWVKKASAITLSALIIGLTLTSGFLVSNAVAAPAQADILEDIICSKEDSTYGFLGGKSGVMDYAMQLSGALGTTTLLPIATPNDPDAKLTAYEKYTPFSPNFDYWVGIYDEGEDTRTFKGTGGNADGIGTDIQGPAVTVNNAQQSPLYSHGWGDCTNVGKSGGTIFANAIFFTPKVLVGVSAEVFGYAYTSSITNEDSPLYPLAEAVENLILGENGSGGLKDTLYLPFLTPLIMIGAISLLYVGIIKRSSTEAFQAAIWMVLAGVLGLLFLSKPLLVPTALLML
jgi:hypothetical protein